VRFINRLERVAVLADQHNNGVKITVESGRRPPADQRRAQDGGRAPRKIGRRVSGEAIAIASTSLLLCSKGSSDGRRTVGAALQCPHHPSRSSCRGGNAATNLLCALQIAA